MHRWSYSLSLVLGMLAVFPGVGHALGVGDVNHHGPAHPNEEYGAQKLAENVYAYIGKDGGSNSGFIVAPEGVIVIDAQDNAELAANELAAIREITKAPIKFLIDTHHHGDHTGGNHVYEKEGAVIISHRECRAAMVERQMKGSPESRLAPSPSGRGREAGLPTLTFDGHDAGVQLYLGGREVHVYHYGWGHTKGDAVIAIPDVDVVFAGDILFSKKFPYVGDGNLAGWVGSLGRLKALNAKKIVPGHGLVSTNAEVDDLMKFFAEMSSAVTSLRREGKSVEECKKRVDLKRYVDAGWGGGFFDSLPPLIIEWLYKPE